jgi:hypothetical protein
MRDFISVIIYAKKLNLKGFMTINHIGIVKSEVLRATYLVDSLAMVLINTKVGVMDHAY